LINNFEISWGSTSSAAPSELAFDDSNINSGGSWCRMPNAGYAREVFMLVKNNDVTELALLISEKFAQCDTPVHMASLSYDTESVRLRVRLQNNQVVESDDTQFNGECWELAKSSCAELETVPHSALVLINCFEQSLVEMNVH
jgi:hypothetical protein